MVTAELHTGERQVNQDAMQREGKGSEKPIVSYPQARTVPFQVVYIRTMYTREVGQLQKQEANSRNG